MRPRNSLKREFLKKWMMDLQRCSSLNKDMSILDRKEAIKLSADVAMACARNGATCWSRALIADAHSKHGASREYNNNRIRSKKVLKRSCRIRIRRSKCAAQVGRASSISKGLVRQRTWILKSLIPGGESMNGACLVEETLDYIISLRAQVDGMRSLVNAFRA